MKEHWNAALVSLVPEFLELRSIQVVTADVRGDEHADEAQLVQAARHLFQQCIHIVEGKVSERFEPPWVAKAGTRKPIVHQPAKFGEMRSEEHTSELQSRRDLVCRLLLEKKKRKQ